MVLGRHVRRVVILGRRHVMRRVIVFGGLLRGRGGGVGVRGWRAMGRAGGTRESRRRAHLGVVWVADRPRRLVGVVVREVGLRPAEEVGGGARVGCVELAAVGRQSWRRAVVGGRRRLPAAHTTQLTMLGPCGKFGLPMGPGGPLLPPARVSTAGARAAQSGKGRWKVREAVAVARLQPSPPGTPMGGITPPASSCSERAAHRPAEGSGEWGTSGRRASVGVGDRASRLPADQTLRWGACIGLGRACWRPGLRLGGPGGLTSESQRPEGEERAAAHDGLGRAWLVGAVCEGWSRGLEAGRTETRNGRGDRRRRRLTCAAAPHGAHGSGGPSARLLLLPD